MTTDVRPRTGAQPGDDDRTELTARFEAIYRTHRPELVDYATRHGADDPELVADLALLDLHRAMDRLAYDHPRVHWAYLYRALRSHLIRAGSKAVPEPVEVIAEQSDGLSLEGMVVDRMRLDEALGQLTENQETVIRSLYFEGMTPSEIGEAVGKSPAAVRQLHRAGLKQLRRIIYGIVMLLLMAIAVATVRQTWDGSLPDNGPVGTPSTTPTTSTSTSTSIPVAEDRSSSIGPPDSLFGVPGGPARMTKPPDGSQLDGNAGQVLLAPHPAHVLHLYDGFDVDVTQGALPDVFAGRGSFGFDDGSGWSVVDGELAATYDATGLAYVDQAGDALQTRPGAVTLTATTSWAAMERTFAPWPIGDRTFWVSYLLRADSTARGDAFWQPDNVTGQGAVGMQSTGTYRFVNGPTTDIPVAPGESVLLVVEIGRYGGRLWVDPLLRDPGAADAALSEPLRSLGLASRFAFFNYEDGVYTIDEFRLGDSFEAVTPIQN
ncbi:MAG: sigma-70 family RNA polymerase sigma factor [Actinomycetota bacterium]